MYMRPIYNYRDYLGDRCDHQKKRLPLQFLAWLSLVASVFLSCLGQSHAADHAAPHSPANAHPANAALFPYRPADVAVAGAGS